MAGKLQPHYLDRNLFHLGNFPEKAIGNILIALQQGWRQEFFQRGADSSIEGAKIRFSGYHKCKTLKKNSCIPSDEGLACFNGVL